MYGNYGSWGGLGGFPSRSGAPNSQAVQSDPEFRNAWQSKLDAVPQYVSDPGAASIPGTQTITMDNVDRYQNNVVPFAGEYGRTHYSVGGEGIQSMTAGTGPSTPQSVNPEWQRINDQMQTAMSQRTENQNRQQQAYNFGMLGGNDRNGLLNANYSQPGYGQISGQDQSAAFGADGGTQLGGVNDQFITGAYTPSNSGATYNPNPYSAQNFQPKGWGL
jgi:hypothetical protein